jgi:hypothetical protein
VVKYMGPRREPGRAPSAEAMFFHSQAQALPPEVCAVIDPQDPALDYVVDALTAMRAVGCDMSDPVVLALAADAGRRKALDFAATLESGQFERDQQDWRQAEIERARRFFERRETWSVVYYARLGNRCKIGWTADLKQRMTDIQPEELLATERGGPALETERHEQFKALRVVGEWFRYEGSLVEHVEALCR